MLVFPNCKINIGLKITAKRSDGYHDLETVFYPIYKLHDAIEILPQQEGNANILHKHSESVNYHFTGLPVNGNAENNLCLRAYELLKRDFPELPPIDLCLHKAIPMGAGLGGGSADGAFTLQLLNQKFNLKLLTSQLLDYALQLGSDCPFFIINKPCFGWGRGEMLEPVSLNLSDYSIILIHPDVHISTAHAFAGIVPLQPIDSLQELIMQPIENWKENIINDFEVTVFKQHPLLQLIKNRLYETDALYASMSGSGSSLYGIYKKEKLPTEKLYPNFFELHTTL
jgi:4-diphosphocytidyl-2-C-methyl-D-erythritol kinase